MATSLLIVDLAYSVVHHGRVGEESLAVVSKPSSMMSLLEFTENVRGPTKTETLFAEDMVQS